MDKYSKFCTEFKRLLEKYDAKITIIPDDDGEPFISCAIVSGKDFGSKLLVRETSLCKSTLVIHSDNIGSHG